MSPAEIESILKQHDQIADAAVAGVYRTDGITEVPRAYVVRKLGPNAPTLTAETVYHFARTRLASYKALDGGVVFVDHIPRTASGKVQRFKLRALRPELPVIENLVTAHYQAHGDPEAQNKAGSAVSAVSAVTESPTTRRKASTNTQAFVATLEMSNGRMAKRRRHSRDIKQGRVVSMIT